MNGNPGPGFPMDSLVRGVVPSFLEIVLQVRARSPEEGVGRKVVICVRSSGGSFAKGRVSFCKVFSCID